MGVKRGISYLTPSPQIYYPDSGRCSVSLTRPDLRIHIPLFFPRQSPVPYYAYQHAPFPHSGPWRNPLTTLSKPDGKIHLRGRGLGRVNRDSFQPPGTSFPGSDSISLLFGDISGHVRAMISPIQG